MEFGKDQGTEGNWNWMEKPRAHHTIIEFLRVREIERDFKEIKMESNVYSLLI